MAGKVPKFNLAGATDPVAPPESDSQPRSQPTPSATTPRPRSGRGVDAGPAGEYPQPLSGAVRLPDDEMPAAERARWRHTLRAEAGRLAKRYAAAAEGEDAWNSLAEQARAAGVPASLITGAMADAGLPVSPA